MKKILLCFVLFFYVTTPVVYANEQAIQNGLNFLKSKQDASGKITTGFSSPSQWSAIAFQANGIDTTTVKNPTASLYDFLLSDIPSNDSATEWETRILAIVAVGGNPSNFNGTNYLQKLESFYIDNQIGDTCSLNDDIFGLLALVASGSTANEQVKQDTLTFLINKQDTTDGGFGFSAPGCPWYSTSADMTGAGVQALIAAKNAGMTHSDLDSAIEKAKAYLVTNQNSDGGYGYFGTSDTDTTGWVLMGLNALGMQSSEQANKAIIYLLSQQSPIDGGIMAYDWGSSTFVANATTTAHALIGFAGKSWILQIYPPSATSSSQITPPASNTPPTNPSPTITPTPTPKSELTSVDQQVVLYQTITITTTPSPRKSTKSPVKINKNNINEEVLGETIREETPKQHKDIPESSPESIKILSASANNPAYLLIAFGALCLAILFFLKGLRKIKAKSATMQF